MVWLFSLYRLFDIIGNMSDNDQMHANLPLSRLAIPMYTENLLRSALSSVDVFMLSFFSEKAVAAVGLCNNLTFFILLIYSMISTGTSVLLAQYLGAKLNKETGHTILASFVLAIGFSLVLSLAAVCGAPALLSVYGLEKEVYDYAWQYLVIFGAGSVFVAFNVVQAAIVRAYGHANDAMYANIAANILNIIGNSLVLFGPFTLPMTKVAGVALSTVISQIIACFILHFAIRAREHIHIPWHDVFKVPADTYKKLLAIGVPSAGEGVSYSIGQNIMAWFIASFGTAAMAANTYVLTLTRFTFMPAFSIGTAGQIKTGYLVGAKRADDASRNVYRYTYVGWLISGVASLLLFIFCKPILGIFTKEVEIITLASGILLISIAREIGRVPNIIVIPSLKGAGDVFFPVLIGMIFMWGLGVGGAYLFGVALGWGLAGVWVAIAADEWVRGIIMLMRWKSDAWRSKSLVHRAAT